MTVITHPSSDTSAPALLPHHHQGLCRRSRDEDDVRHKFWVLKHLQRLKTQNTGCKMLKCIFFSSKINQKYLNNHRSFWFIENNLKIQVHWYQTSQILKGFFFYEIRKETKCCNKEVNFLRKVLYDPSHRISYHTDSNWHQITQIKK